MDVRSLQTTLTSIVDLARYARHYHILLQGGSAFPRLNQCIWRLNYLGTHVARPYLLEVLDMHQAGALTDEELLGIFEVWKASVRGALSAVCQPTPSTRSFRSCTAKFCARVGLSTWPIQTDSAIT